MVIDQYLTSIANYLWQTGKQFNEGLKVCFHEMPENGKLPVIYFPNPSVTSGNDTLSGYYLDYSWYVKIFAVTNEQAYEIASGIQREIGFNRFKIPFLDKNGVETGYHIKVNRPDIKQIDTHSFQLTLDWKERNHYKEAPSRLFKEMEFLIVDKNVEPFDVLIDEDGNNFLTDDEGFILISTGG